MTSSKLLIAAWSSMGVFLITWVLATFALDPENIGGRLGLYLLGMLAFLAWVVLLIIGLVRWARERRS